MDYYSSTFNTLHKPEETKTIHNIKSKDLYKFLDFMFLVLDLDIQKFNYSLKTPKNILISFTKDKFRVFIGDDKAVTEMNMISYQSYIQKELLSLSEANELGIQQLGFKFDYYFDVDIVIFELALPFINNNFEKERTSKLQIFGELNKCMSKILDQLNTLSPNKILEKSKELKNDNIVNEFSIAFFYTWYEIHKQIMKEIEERELIMNINPRFKARGIVINPTQCFYVMQFNDDLIDEAHEAISQKLKEKLKIDVIKSGDIFDPNRNNDIVENIWQDIMASKFVIADLSKRNPNVFYELGICDTVGKTVIPVCSKKSFEEDYHGKFPFDIQQEMAIIYENGYKGITHLQEEILKRASAILNGQAINISR